MEIYAREQISGTGVLLIFSKGTSQEQLDDARNNWWRSDEVNMKFGDPQRIKRLTSVMQRFGPSLDWAQAYYFLIGVPDWANAHVDYVNIKLRDDGLLGGLRWNGTDQEMIDYLFPRSFRLKKLRNAIDTIEFQANLLERETFPRGNKKLPRSALPELEPLYAKLAAFEAIEMPNLQKGLEDVGLWHQPA